MPIKRPRTHQGQVVCSNPNPEYLNSLVRDHFPLPVELVLQIISNFARVSYETDLRLDEDSYWERQDVLRVLSQTSRVLRNICLPLLWEHLVMSTHREPMGVKRFNYSHCMTSGGFDENPALATYVRVVDLQQIDGYLGPLSELVASLSSLPNVHTLRIFTFPYMVLPEVFARVVFLQVRTLILPACFAIYVIPSCPRVRAVISSARMKGWNSFVGLFDRSSETLEDLQGFVMGPESIKYIVEIAPNLRTLKFPEWINPEHLILLKPLKKLHTIEMEVLHEQYRRRRQDPMPASELTRWMTAAKEVLAGNEGHHGKTHGGKRIRMQYQWVDFLNRDEDAKPRVVARIEDVEVD